MSNSKLVYQLSEIPSQNIDQILISVTNTNVTEQLATDFAGRVLSVSANYPNEKVIQATEESLSDMHKIGLVSDDARNKLLEAIKRSR